MSTGPSLGRSTAVMAAGTATSRVLGLVRGAVLGAAIGLNVGAANAFAVANWLPNMIYMLLAGGVLNAVLVPQVVKAYRSEQGQEFVDRLLTLAATILIGVAAVVTVAAPVVVRIATSSSDPEFVRLATTFALWCLPQIFFYGVYTLLGQVLNARGNFGPFMWAPVANNVVAIAGLAVFIGVFGGYDVDAPANLGSWDTSRVVLLAGTATLGVIVQAAVLVWPLYRSGFRYRPRFGWRGVGLASAGRVAGWTFGALAVGQLGILTVTRITSSAAEKGGYGLEIAGNNAYNYAFLVFMLPHSLVTVSLLTALFTRLSGSAVAGDVAAVRRDTSYGLRTLGVFTIFATAVLAVLALPVSRLVLPSVTPEEVSALAPVIVALVGGLVALGIWSLVQRVHYAYEDARALFWLQLPMSVLVAGGTFAGSLLLAPGRWTVAAGASIAASYVLGAVRGVLAVRRRLGGSGRGVLRVHVRATVAALAAAALGWPLSHLFGDLSRVGLVQVVLCLALVGLVMLGVYLGLLRLMGVTELNDLIAPALNRLGRTMRTPVGARGDRGTPTRHGGGLLDGVAIGRGTLLAGRYRLGQPTRTDLPGVESWDAQDQILDREVRALILRGERAGQAQDAARRAALVNDPRLLRILDVGDHEGVAYTVTEPLTGRDLASLTAHGPLPADQARALIGEAAVALEVARRRGVHHLALRPSAVRLTDEGSVLVTGLALDGELLSHGIGDARSTTRADTVGLVALLYLCLTGRWPAVTDVEPSHVPVAPQVGGGPVPPAELSPAVPNDLDTLCAVTLGPHDDGPHSPAELVRELEPWGPLSAPDLLAQADERPGGLPPGAVAAAAATPVAQGDAVDAADDEPEDEPVTENEPDDEAARDEDGTAAETEGGPAVRRAPVGEALAGGAGLVPRPGTPPPAVPPPFHRGRPETPTVHASNAPRSSVTETAVPPPVRPQPSAGGGGASPGARPAADTIRRFDPTPWVLGLVLVALVIAVVTAYGRITAPLPPIGGSDGFGDVSDVTEEPTDAATEEGDPAAEEGTDDGTDDGTTEPTGEAAPPPTIASAAQIDPPPNGDNNEHPEAVDRAIDGDPGTFWFSRTYASATYGMKAGIGYGVTLAEETLVSSVTVDVAGSGGVVEIRATDVANPTKGDVLATGPVGPATVFTFAEPVRTQSIVLWWTTLPQTSDGSNRIELREITVAGPQ